VTADDSRIEQALLCFRTGCGSALQSYLVECGDLIANRTSVCSETCKNTLVGLTSSQEGNRLMQVSNSGQR
jgi:hypothetical protein